MTQIKGVFVYKGLVYITKATSNNLLTDSEPESRQMADQKQAVKHNQIWMVVIPTNFTSPLLIVKIENFMTEDCSSRLFYKIIKRFNEKCRPKDTMSRVVQK